MTRFLSQLGLFLLLQAGVLAILAARYPGRANSYLEATIDKHDRAAATPPPRLFLVGGSNVAFGLDSTQLDEALAHHPVNLGLQAALGVDFILNEARHYVGPGDAVVVSLEYEIFRFNTVDVTLTVLLEIRPASVRFTNWSLRKQILDGGLGYLRVYVRRAIKGKESIRLREVYARDAFNEYGDVIGHHENPAEWEGKDLSAKVTVVDVARLQTVVRLLEEFAAECRDRGALVFYEFPAIPSAEYDALRPLLDELEDELERSRTITVLNRPEEAVLPDDAFFDTKYHLRREAKRARTSALVERLRPILKAQSSGTGSSAGPG